MTAVARQPDPATASGTAERTRLAVAYAVLGDLRFLSHHDELRLLRRAFVRARWPVSYSRGFNPQPRMSIPLPRNTGIAADPQFALVDVEPPVDSAALAARLAATLPRACPLRGVTEIARQVVPHPRRATYAAEVPEDQTAEVGARIASLLGRAEIVIAREHGPNKRPQIIDIRPYIETVDLAGTELRLVLAFEQQRTARPTEVLTELGLRPQALLGRLRRVGVDWDLALPAALLGTAAQERNSLD